MKSDAHHPQMRFAVGLNSSLKLIRSGCALKVYLAGDCAVHVRQAVLDAAAEHSVPVDETKTMAQLGAARGIDVGCAVCALRKE